LYFLCPVSKGQTWQAPSLSQREGANLRRFQKTPLSYYSKKTIAPQEIGPIFYLNVCLKNRTGRGEGAEQIQDVGRFFAMRQKTGILMKKDG
jgi:hypothetical protein